VLRILRGNTRCDQGIEPGEVLINCGLIMKIVGNRAVDGFQGHAGEIERDLLRAGAQVIAFNDVFEPDAMALQANDLRVLEVQVIGKFHCEYPLTGGMLL
jgi:hypothetical protein